MIIWSAQKFQSVLQSASIHAARCDARTTGACSCMHSAVHPQPALGPVHMRDAGMVDPCVGVRHWSTGHARRDWTSLITHDAILAADIREGLEIEPSSPSVLALTARTARRVVICPQAVDTAFHRPASTTRRSLQRSGLGWAADNLQSSK